MNHHQIKGPLGAILLGLLALAGCDHPLPSAPGGELSRSVKDRNALQFPARAIVGHERLSFSVGHSFFKNPWVMAPSATEARDGLGPLFNANSCVACHQHNGRGQLPADKPYMPHGLLLRLSDAQATRSPETGIRAHPFLGEQLQTRALPGLRPEGQIHIEYSEKEVSLKGYPAVTLQEPHYRIDQSTVELDDSVRLSPRLAPPLIGLGLLEAIPDRHLRKLADPDDKDGDGISGRLNMVWDRQKQATTIGRFGWKAAQPSLKQQVAAALNADMGITSQLYPDSNCPGRIIDCNRIPDGGKPEISDKLVDSIVFYLAGLSVPEFRLQDKHRTGWLAFREIGCAQCHTPRQKTGVSDLPWLSHQTIYPFSDLLLHDMGEQLADSREEFTASGREWRTAPLWGLGLTDVISSRTGYLHDGRARTLEEAILWHGGEADSSVAKFVDMDPFERLALIQFLQSL